ncbi:MAG: polysaccharide pyruvyl transferase CsaB [Oscillospiraceae bacterium]|nr:polysaccharide pyruvyl transferase CsaB [Oscillospiraceae bacterium]
MSFSAGKQNKRAGVLICGAYGHGNAGDEAILEAVVMQMREIDADMPVTVLSRRPEETKKRYGVDSLHTFDFIGFYGKMRKTELYINGGGSLIQDITSRRSLWYYLFTILLAKKTGNRVIMYGCGIGPVIRGYNKRLAGRIINDNVDVITLREPKSLEELSAFGVSEPEIILTSDPAMSLSAAEETKVRDEFLKYGMDPDGKYICFALRRWPGFKDKARCFTDAANHAYEKYGLTPVFISINHRNDGEAADAAAGGLRIPCHILRDPMPAGITIGMMKRMTAVISMRLHGLIFAAVAGVPLVGISYDPKINSFADYMGQMPVADLEKLESEKLRELTDFAIGQGASKEILLQNAGRLAEIERRNADCVRKLLSRD